MPDTKTLTGLAPCDFNAQCYSDRYPDLQTAFRGDANQLLNHWNNFGRREGRIPCCPSQMGADPSLDIAVKFSTGVTDSVPNTCPTILAAARRAGTPNAFLSIYKFDELKANLQAFQTKLTSPAIDQLQAITSRPGYSEIYQYIQDIERTQLPVQRLVQQCLREEMEIDTTTPAAKLEESKSRYEAITTPEKRVSYYEGWFPLFRPMKEPALFGIFATGLALLLISILVFLRMQGVQIKMEFPELFLAGFDLSPYTGYMYGAAAFGLAVALFGHFYFKWF